MRYLVYTNFPFFPNLFLDTLNEFKGVSRINSSIF